MRISRGGGGGGSDLDCRFGYLGGRLKSVASRGSSYHDADSTATAIMKDGGPNKTVVVVWDAMRRDKNLKPFHLLGAKKGLATFHRSILERGDNGNNVVGIQCFQFSGYSNDKLQLIAHLLTLFRPVGKALEEAKTGEAGKGLHRECVQEKEEKKATAEKTEEESRLEERLTAMKDAGLFLCEHVCLGLGVPCTYIYKTN